MLDSRFGYGYNKRMWKDVHKPGRKGKRVKKRRRQGMDRAAVARETLEIIRQGYYFFPENERQKGIGKRIEIGEDIRQSVEKSFLLTPEQGEELLETYGKNRINACDKELLIRKSIVENTATVEAVRRLSREGKFGIGVLNFASAKNPGGGFLNGAMAQEESLAASGSLYPALTRHETYYRINRAQRSMMYTDYAIYAPDVVFFRDGKFCLVEDPVKASVLTLPAVNMGQVLLKGEDSQKAEQVMRRRMKLVLCIFAGQGAKHLVLGAYGCGVFRNDPKQIAVWWKELLEEGLGNFFDSITYAVLDRAKNQACIRAFEEVLG